MNGSEAAVAQEGSLYGRKPVLAGLYVAVLGVAAVVGTLDNLIVIVTVSIRYTARRRTNSKNGGAAGKAFIVNLALSDTIVTALINPLAIAGLSGERTLL